MVTELVLDAEGIDRAVEEVATFLANARVSKREVLAGRLTFENGFLLLRDKLGEGSTGSIQAIRRFGRSRLKIVVPGSKFNPFASLDDFEHRGAFIGRSLLEVSGLQPTYSYRGGSNIITVHCPARPLSTLSKIIIAFVVGLVSAHTCEALFGHDTCSNLLDSIVTPLFNLYLGMLSGIAGPLVFLSVAWGVCGIGDVTALGKSGKAILSRFLRDDLFAAVLAMAVCIPLFKLPFSASASAGDLMADLVRLFVGLFPTNVFAPFVEGNTSQIIILGAVVGVAALVLGNVFEHGRIALQELNSLVQFLMEQLCRLIPLFIFVMMLSQVWSGAFSALLSSWLPFVLVIGISVAMFAAQVIFMSVRRHIPLGRLVKAIRPGVLVALTTASSTASFSSMLDVCTDDLGVEQDFTSFSLPLGIVACQNSTTILLVVMMMYCMSVNGLGADVSWYIRLALTSFLYAIVAPPVPGGMLVCYGLMFTELGIPESALALVTAIDVILDYPVTATRIGTIMLEVYDAACSLGVVRGKERKSA